MIQAYDVQKCIEACQECLVISDVCADDSGKISGMELCSKLCLQCADACDEHINRLGKGDHSMAQECIAACIVCAEECEKGTCKMEFCRHCAATCRVCVETCRKAELVLA